MVLQGLDIGKGHGCRSDGELNIQGIHSDQRSNLERFSIAAFMHGGAFFTNRNYFAATSSK